MHLQDIKPLFIKKQGRLRGPDFLKEGAAAFAAQNEKENLCNGLSPSDDRIMTLKCVRTVF